MSPGLRYRVKLARFQQLTWYSLLQVYRTLTWPMREPRFWWFCIRLRLHHRFGLPFPDITRRM